MEAYERDHLDMLRGYLADCAVLLKSDGAFPLYLHAAVLTCIMPSLRMVNGCMVKKDINIRKSLMSRLIWYGPGVISGFLSWWIPSVNGQ